MIEKMMIFKNFNRRLAQSPAMAILFAMLGLAVAAPATAAYTVTPITWNVIGLDSNDPSAGPNRFPVGARVCGGTPNTTLLSTDPDAPTFTWDTATGPEPAGSYDNAGTYIYLRTGSANPVSVTFNAGGCADAYFEVEVSRLAASRDKRRRYHISAGGVSTPTPRELYVGELISQGRNGITDIKFGPAGGALTSVAAGGSMNLVVGNSYDIELDAYTATQGYSQLESFLNFSNTVFQITAVSTTFSVVSSPNSGGVTSPNSYLYADSCLWDNDPYSPTYLSCLGTGNAGGTIATKYTVKILGGGGTTQTLNSLAHDSSGGSLHYNSDYSATARFANIIDPYLVTISKSFFPSTTNAGGATTLIFTLTNPNAGAVSGLNFIDVFPTAPNLPDTGGGITLASTAVTNTCGGPALQNSSGGLLAVGATGIKLPSGSIPGNSSCIVQVSVTPAATGTYTNISDHLYIDTLDTCKTDNSNAATCKATASLTVNNTPTPPSPSSTCTTPVEFAAWNLDALATGANSAPLFSFKAADVSTATAAAVANGGPGFSSSIVNTTSNTASNSWVLYGSTPNTTASYNTANASYIDFTLDTSNYGGAQISLFAYTGNGTWGSNNHLYVWSSTDGSTFLNLVSTTSLPTAWTNYAATAAATGSTTTYFRVNAAGSKNSPNFSPLYLDTFSFKGCTRPDPTKLTIGKSFSPATVAVGGTSTLTFTIANTNVASTGPLSGVGFTDTFPTQALQGTVAVANGSPAVTGTGTVFTTQLVAGSIVSISGVSYTVSSIASNTSLTLTTNYAGATASGLTMSAGLTYVSTTSNSCGGTLQDNGGGALAAPDPGIKLSGVTVAQGGSCTVVVVVKANSAGARQNVSGQISFVDSSSATKYNTSSSGIATATLTAVLPPVISKLFAPNPILANNQSTLTFTLTNPNQNDALASVSFTDAFPILALTGTVAVTNGSPTVTGTGTAFQTQLAAGNIVSISGVAYKVSSIASNTSLTLTTNYAGATASGLTMSGSMAVASPLTTTNTCGGAALQDSGGGVLAADDVGIKLPGGSIPAGGSCTVSVKVTAPTTGAYNNTSGNVSHVINAATVNGNTASATLTVNPAHPAITVFKEVASTNTGSTVWGYYLTVATGGNVYYRIQVQNDGDVPLTSVSVADFPQVGDDPVSLAGCTWRDGDNNLLAAPFTLPVASISNNQHFAVCTIGPYAAVAGTHTNTAKASGTYSTIVYTDTDWAEYATTGITITKSATQTYFTAAGNVLNYSYVVSNSGSASLQGPVTVTDDKATATCPSVSTAILTASLPAIVLGDGDNWLDPGEQITCTGTYTVVAADVTAKQITNIAYATISGVNSNTPNPSVTLPLASDLAATKTNNVTGAVLPGDSFNWVITVANSTAAGTATFTSGQTLLTDDMPSSGATYGLGTVKRSGISGTGSISCAIASNSLTCTSSGGTTIIPPSLQGTLSVTNGNAAVTGVGTSFTTELAAGSVILIGGVPYTVSSITNNLSLTLTANYAGATAGGLTVPGSFTVPITVTTTAAGSLVNPRSGGICRVDPGTVVGEISEANNDCANTVSVQLMPSITLLKTVSIYWDPVKLLVNPKFIPGAIAQYSIIASNSGGAADNNSTVITDPIPANTALYVNDIGGAPAGPVSFVDGATTSSLTLGAANISYSNSGAAGPWTYVPVAGADGCDPAVTHLRVNPQGSFAGGGTPSASFQLIFRTCVK